MSPPPRSPSPSPFISPQPTRYFNFASPTSVEDPLASSPPRIPVMSTRRNPIGSLPSARPTRRAAASPVAGPSEPTAKRRRTNASTTLPGEVSNTTHNAAQYTGSRAAPIEIEDLDRNAEEDSALARALQKQRAEAIKAQLPPTDQPTNFTNMTCVICMDSPTDLTATVCGEF
jgi:hypothetical protein